MKNCQKRREEFERAGKYIYPRCCTYSMKRMYEWETDVETGKKLFVAKGWRCVKCLRYLDDTHPDIKERMEKITEKIAKSK